MTTPTIHTSVQRDVLDNATLRLAFDQPDYRLPAWVQEASTKSDNGKSAVRLISLGCLDHEFRLTAKGYKRMTRASWRKSA